MKHLGTHPYEKGLREVADGCWAWLQPDGGWGLSNAGLIADAGEGFLVDTLYDQRLTEEMLGAMRRRIPAANNICTLANTHSNGDHCNGNACVPEATVIASRHTAEDMPKESPAMMADLLASTAEMGEVGEFFAWCFGDFDFAGVLQRLPDRTFDKSVKLAVGDLDIDLETVGPAHTRGDILIRVPEKSVVFTGDILFVEDHPIVWAGPVGNWLRALDRIVQLEPEVVVPGHGPVTDLRGVKAMADYLKYVYEQARLRHESGMSVEEAARDIGLTDYDSWGCAERIVVNVAACFSEFEKRPMLTPVEGFALMARLWKDRR